MSFKRAWSKVLQAYGVSRFHARDFFAGNFGGPSSVYHGWQTDKAVAFLHELVATINGLNLRPIGGAIVVNDFNALTLGERRILTGGLWSIPKQKFVVSGAPTKPYFAAFVRFLIEAMEQTPKNAITHFVFDRQNVMERNAARLFHGLTSYHAFEGHEKLGSLQYADPGQELAL